ncbi:hypothetical protein MNEG_5335 [Monoraphidium neglectum]|uniref:Uncharacterized protein n=1 Tax=Monoraphidium neglectum TaxID=145388 RepID=A0A0D2NAS1_9CHLO|nr:hypothetical protein MNEG_5335 [Monoraphidium neglectum]KIZ02621.1 hypothetical protein MNEG_5335 [Monoraphidium neglectum]|eukprot:XP_013901640.1 hypothetical protein MNEG_5335 [Monoraphidium neglectum]
MARFHWTLACVLALLLLALGAALGTPLRASGLTAARQRRALVEQPAGGAARFVAADGVGLHGRATGPIAGLGGRVLAVGTRGRASRSLKGERGIATARSSTEAATRRHRIKGRSMLGRGRTGSS